MNIAESLNAKGATPETILQILSTTVFEISGDLSEAEMEAELNRQLGEISVAEAKDIVALNPDVVDEVAGLWVGALAVERNREDLLSGAIEDADTRLPMLEIGALTLIALYSLYLAGPTKPTQHTITYRQNADGSYEKVVDVKWADFSAPLRGLLGLFARKGGGGES